MTIDASFWVLVAFLIVLFFIGRPAFKAAGNYLDARAQKIRSEIEAAAKLKNEAELLLQDTKRMQNEAAQHAKEILEHAKKQSERIRSQSQEELDAYLQQQEKLLTERGKRLEQEALMDIETKAVEVALQAVRDVLKDSPIETHHDKLVEDALKLIESFKVA